MPQGQSIYTIDNNGKTSTFELPEEQEDNDDEDSSLPAGMMSMSPSFGGDISIPRQALDAAQNAMPKQSKAPSSPQQSPDTYSQMQDQIMGSIPRMQAARQEQAAAQKDMYQGEGKAAEDYLAQRKQIREDNPISKVDFSGQPQAPEVNPLANFGSIASMIGIFGSMFTRKPMINALNASADAMNASREGDTQRYNQAYKSWKDNIDLAIKKHDTEVESLSDILKDADKDYAGTMAKLKAYGAANESSAASTLAEMGDMQEVGKYFVSMGNMKTKMADSQRKTDEYFSKQQQRMDLDDLSKQVYQQTIQSGGTPTQAAIDAQQVKMGKFTAANKAGPLTDEEYENRYKDDPEIAKLADAYASGASLQQLVPGFGKDNPKRDAVSRKAYEVYPDLNWAEAHNQYMGEASEERSVATQTGKIKLASNMLDQSLPSMMDAAKKVGLSPSTDLNTLYNTVKSRMSNNDFNNFRTQMRAVASDYAQFIGRGRGTVHSDQEALRILNENMGESGLQGFVDAVETERGNIDRAIDITKGKKPTSSVSSQSAIPDAAVKSLKEGTITKFSNGQKWTIQNGQPVQVQ